MVINIWFYLNKYFIIRINNSERFKLMLDIFFLIKIKTKKLTFYFIEVLNLFGALQLCS